MHRCIEKEVDLGVKGSEQPISLFDIEMRFVRGPLNTAVLLLCDEKCRHGKANSHTWVEKRSKRGMKDVV